MSIIRMLLRISGTTTAEDGRRRGICDERGYCGPFVNQSSYNRFAAWQGFGECVECGCTVPVPLTAAAPFAGGAQGTDDRAVLAMA